MMKIKLLVAALLSALALCGSAYADTQPLSSTSWQVVSYNNGKQAISSVIVGSSITAYFGPDGTLYGSAGCNDYTTSYSTTGDAITIKPAAATRKMCVNPEGVMDQETAFLNALDQAARFNMRDDILELYYPDGNLAVSLKSIAQDRTAVFRSGKIDALIETHGPDELYMTIEGKTYHMVSAISASGARYVERGDTRTEFWNKGDMATITVKGKKYPDEFRLVKDTLGEDELYVTIDGETFVMKRVPAASGAKYEAVDDPSTVFWSKGRNASLTVRGREYSKYVLIRNSPREDELFLSVDGENFLLKRVPAASGAKYEATGDPTTYFWSKGDTATLVVRGQEYMGYDAPKPTERPTTPQAESQTLPTGVEWRVTSIAGTAVIPGSTVTIRFDKDGRLNGKASINGYMSSWLLAGDRILINGAASTMMAGPPELMNQEQHFLSTLEKVRRYEIRGGDLVLSTNDGEEIVAAR